jgi:predicted ATPase/DNA-binding SARP family transcriptional activator
MHIGLLGGLEVLDDSSADADKALAVPAGKQQALLAMLALHVGRVVPAEQLVDALWGEDPPPGVRNGLQALASRLRSVLGSAALVVMRGNGYALELPADAIDVHRYEQLVAQGRAAAADDPRRAVTLMAEADSLWRGDALADFAYDEFALPAISRLSELRLSVTEERIGIELELGRIEGGIVELETLVSAHPLREGLRGLLMVALYREGRQADALRVFQDGRHILGEELGLEPGPELRRLEAAILAQDASLDAPDGASSSPVPRGPRHSTIPEALTSLIGREDELRCVVRLFEDHRFVTLVGPGGVGKTRLALEVARGEAAVLADGGCLVELAAVGDPSAVRTAVASALEMPDPGRLAELIGRRDVLIVLDNCEHVIDAAAAVAEDLLRRCPGLRLLATSREALRVGGETVWPVPPLAADDAVRLFVARAKAAGAQLEISDDLLALIGDICARLDGMPLAIELAAARARAFPIHQISTRLNDRFRLLTGGSRTALPRQQTLRAVVDWSYELLFEDERRVFERLSVFPGGCDLATAEAVCADGGLAAADVADIVHALVDKSLVVAARSGDELRFTQLQTLAHYGQEKLAERGDATRIRNAMAAHFAALCAGSAAAYAGAHQRAWLTVIDQEQDNLRAALEWAVANDDAETALAIAGGASWPHWLAGTVIEGKRWLDEAFACAGVAGERTCALALTGRGVIGVLAGAAAQSDVDLADALVIFRRFSDVHSMALAYSFYAELPMVQGDVDEARRRRREVLAFYTGLPDEPFAVAAVPYSLAKLELMDGDLVGAEQHYRQAVAGFSRDRPVMRAICLGVLADFDERAGRSAAAIEDLEEAIELSEAVGLRGFAGSQLSRLAWVLLEGGNASRAEIMNVRALDLAQRLGNSPALYLALTGAAALHRHRRRDAAAVAAATEALQLYLAGGPRRFSNRIDPEFEIVSRAAVCCVVLAVVAAERGDGARGARWLGYADHIREERGVPVPAFQRDDLDRARDAATAVIGHDAFLAAVEAGRGAQLGALLDTIA